MTEQTDVTDTVDKSRAREIWMASFKARQTWNDSPVNDTQLAAQERIFEQWWAREADE